MSNTHCKGQETTRMKLAMIKFTILGHILVKKPNATTVPNAKPYVALWLLFKPDHHCSDEL